MLFFNAFNYFFFCYCIFNQINLALSISDFFGNTVHSDTKLLSCIVFFFFHINCWIKFFNWFIEIDKFMEQIYGNESNHNFESYVQYWI